MTTGARHGQRRGRRLAPEERAEIVAKHRAGATTAELAAVHGLCQRSVARIVREAAGATQARRRSRKSAQADALSYKLQSTALRPAGITAPLFTTSWFRQNDLNFRSVMKTAHPELFRVEEQGRGSGGCPANHCPSLPLDHRKR
jgi:hypothetical protein